MNINESARQAQIYFKKETKQYKVDEEDEAQITGLNINMSQRLNKTKTK